jgi:hypothetical protein
MEEKEKKEEVIGLHQGRWVERRKLPGCIRDGG